MLKEAKKMQKQMMEQQEALSKQEFEGSAGGGVVKVKVNGAHKILGMELDPEVVDPDDIEMLQDLIVTAINEAMNNADKAGQDQLSDITGNLNIPGMNF